MTTQREIVTRCGGDMIEAVEIYNGVTRDIITAIRELATAIEDRGARAGKASFNDGKVSWTVEVRR